jgi:starch synthase
MFKPLKIVSIASEVAPFSKTGGLADVARSLPKALKRLGHNVMVITPLYEQIIDKKLYSLKLIYSDVEIYLNSEESVRVNYWRGYLMKDVPVYFVEHKKYFSQRKTIYGSAHENVRFFIFDVAALKLISLLKYEADIVHCHDWQTGLIPFFLKTDFRYSRTLHKAKTVYTIHNLVFQFGRNWWEVPADKKDYGRKRLPHLADRNIENINFAKRAILSADVINTVSEQYREEILTKNIGQDLHRILRNRKDVLFGIVNGIDYHSYNPQKDPGLFKNFSNSVVEYKTKNKLGLQKMFDLRQDKKIPVIGMVTRITEQKGFELLFDSIDAMVNLNMQLIIMGGGSADYLKKIKYFIKKYPDKINAHLKFNVKDATKVYSGSDMFLMPSHFEPCGITQLIAMRYGTIPIVRHIGGLVDTVNDFNPRTKGGNGFVFKRYNSADLLIAVTRAIELYKQDNLWYDLVEKIMKESNSWKIPAKKYVDLYKMALRIKNNKKS